MKKEPIPLLLSLCRLARPTILFPRSSSRTTTSSSANGLSTKEVLRHADGKLHPTDLQRPPELPDPALHLLLRNRVEGITNKEPAFPGGDLEHLLFVPNSELR